jgi:S1-C subfamily serine protease
MIRAATLPILAFLALCTTSASIAATTAVPGIVEIETTLGYQGGVMFGTGIVLTSTGEILTNNHVIRGATSIRVTDLDNRRTYSATVAGYDLSADLAVLELRGASGLATIRVGHSNTMRINEPVTAYGNPTGRLGTPISAADGRLVGLGQTIMVFDEGGGARRLTNVIETNAPILPGYSGGPLVDTEGRAIGIDTAGSPIFLLQQDAGRAFAVPIDVARSVAAQIAAGRESAEVHVGPTAFLGLAFQSGRTHRGLIPGITILKIVSGSPASRIRLRRGDLVTQLNGTTIRNADDFESLMQAVKPGVDVTLAWIDSNGMSRSASITATSGPPQ